jgi:hypothetical protein
LSLGLLKGCPSYRRSLKPSKENIQNFTKNLIINFFYFCGSTFLPSWIRIRIVNLDPNPGTPWNPDLDQKHCIKSNFVVQSSVPASINAKYQFHGFEAIRIQNLIWA